MRALRTHTEKDVAGKINQLWGRTAGLNFGGNGTSLCHCTSSDQGLGTRVKGSDSASFLGTVASSLNSSLLIKPTSPSMLFRFGDWTEVTKIWMDISYLLLCSKPPKNLAAQKNKYLLSHTDSETRLSGRGLAGWFWQFSSQLSLRWSPGSTGAREFTSKITHLVANRPSFFTCYQPETSILWHVNPSIATLRALFMSFGFLQSDQEGNVSEWNTIAPQKKQDWYLEYIKIY